MPTITRGRVGVRERGRGPRGWGNLTPAGERAAWTRHALYPLSFFFLLFCFHFNSFFFLFFRFLLSLLFCFSISFFSFVFLYFVFMS